MRGISGKKASWAVLALILASMAALHGLTAVSSEPFYNNDETRHVMTGVFFRDFFRDMPLSHIRAYVVDYYLQYPALGLIVWPPGFYILEGACMLAFGDSFPVAKGLILAFAALSVFYLFSLAKRTHGLATAALAGLFLAFSPLFFLFSHQVMLEMPTLAFSLGAIYYLHRYLENEGRRYLILSSLALALAMLSRFDGIFLFPAMLYLLVMRRRAGILLRKESLISCAVLLVLVLPVYGVTLLKFGNAHLQAVNTGTGADSSRFLAPANFLFYPSCILSQMGIALTLAAAVGGVFLLVRSGERKAAFPYLAMLLGTYVTFSPMAELESRHALYWVPALAFAAARGLVLLAESRLRLAAYAAAGACLVATVSATTARKPEFVIGYREAAEFVLANTRTSEYCLFDNFLNGGFIYQIRTHDPARRLGVLRGDKLFYGVLSDPHAAYKEWAKGKEDILAGIYRYDPEFVIVESPQVLYEMHMATELRKILAESPDRFSLEKTIPLRSNAPAFRGVSLLIYRNRVRNPHPEKLVQVEMVGMGGTLRRDSPVPGAGVP